MEDGKMERVVSENIQSKKKRKHEKAKAALEGSWERCMFKIITKNRYCNIQRVIGSLYCGNHLPTGEQVASNKAKKFKKECRERVPCPIDPRHTCYKYDLEKHILICNKRKDAETMKKLPFYSDNINSGRYILPMSCMEEVESRSDTKTKEDADHQEALSKTQELKFIEKLKSIDFEDLKHRIHAAFENCVEPIPLEKLFHPCCDVLYAEKKAQGASKTSLRHIEQQASILAHMEKLDLLHKGVTYIEMGAGRGMLSLALAQKFQQVINHQERVEIQSGISHPDANSLSYILIDRAGSRGKADHLLSLSSKESRTRPQQHTFRAKIDIRHLNFGAMSEAVNRSVVCMSKHLCGVATDLSLRCISTTLPPVVPNQISPHVKGIAIALCCHHVCTLEDYISPEFFLSQGFQPQEFALLTGMTSWATCGMNGAEAEEGDSVERALGINREDRIILGRKCKRILDTGRLLYIRSHQLQARLVHYCEEQDSLENCLLLAWRAKSV